MGELFSSFSNRLVVVLAVASILLVSGLGFLFFVGEPKAEENMVGVIRVEGAITTSEETNLISEAINQAVFDPNIKAIVLRIDSPGGAAHLVEQIYFDILELKKKKPLAACVVMALSGGYYIATAADYIFTHSSSMVGNVGVIGVGPDILLPSEKNLETGPYKASGFSRLMFPFNLSHVLDNFAKAVENGRGTRLKLSGTELKKGLIYVGSEAVNAGLVDEIGSFQTAAEHVAAEAGLKKYRVVDIKSDSEEEGFSTSSKNRSAVSWRKITIEALNNINPPPAIYYIYLPTVAYSIEKEANNVTVSDETSTITQEVAKGKVVIDLSHGNKVTPWTFDILSAQLAMRGVFTGFGKTWEEVESTLDSTACLIVAAPTSPYSRDEFKAIEKYVKKGRILVLLFDPSIEYMDTTELLHPINSLANRYGLSFGKGYLYNEDDHYGFYRNIYIRQFQNRSLMNGLNEVVFFTSTYLHPTDSDAAWASRDTYSSISERKGRYAPISIIDKTNSTVVAIGDITFLLEPYVYVKDNYNLVMNLVSAITEIEVPVVEPVEPEYNITKPDLPVGTVKRYKELVNGDEQQVIWTRTKENETQVERPNRTVTYYYDENYNLLRWVSEDMELVYDEPMPDIPYPLVDGKAWTYQVTYNLTLEGKSLLGKVKSNGLVKGFEDVVPGYGGRYLCAKIMITEKDELDRIDDILTIEMTQYLWISQEVGLIKAESKLDYYVDDQLAYEEERSILLESIKKGKG